jgi:ABC-type polysaccharide/polyol phosphate transport system ATPase subunit
MTESPVDLSSNANGQAPDAALPADKPVYKVEVANLSKRYNIYDRPVDRLKELVLRNRKSFHREYWALRDIDFKFPHGVTALIGPNGSGKSTLLQIIAGVLEPTTGTVERHGRITAILELGAGFQAEYSGRENVILNGMILGISQEEMLSRIDEIAEFAEIGDFFDQPIKTYSSGMTVRLAFATAVTVDPEILIVDEAMAVGDQAFQIKCRNKIWSLKEAGKTIIFVTHNMEMVTSWCDQAVLLNGGKMVASGAIDTVVPLYEELMENQERVARKTFTPAAPSIF